MKINLSMVALGAIMSGLLAAMPATLAQDKGITIVVNEQPNELDQCSVSASNMSRILSHNVYEAMTEINPNIVPGSTEGNVLPRLATSWEQVESGAWRFHLRPDVTFHNGEALDADAVVASVNRLMTHEPCVSRVKYFTGIQVTATAIDALTVEVTTEPQSQIVPTLMSTLVIVPSATPVGVMTTEPVGTGPYAFVENVPNERIVLSRYDGYWGDTPEVEQATYVFRGESSIRAAMVATGEADLTPVIALQDATNPETDFAYLNGETTMMRIDTELAPLNDIRVREALNLSIDFAALGEALFSPDALISTQAVGPSVDGHNPNITPFPYDPDRARQLLAEAAADGVPVDKAITIIGRPGVYPNSTEVLEAMISMWADVGFNMELLSLEVADYLKFQRRPFMAEREPALLQMQHDNNFGDASFSALSKYHSVLGSNSTVYDTELDKLIEAADAATGPDRTRLYQEVFAYVHDKVIADVFMFHMIGYARVGERIDWRPTSRSNNDIQIARIKFN